MLEKRTKGLVEKFKAGDNLTLFKNNLIEYLMMHGLDTFSYLPDLSSFDDPMVSPKKMFSSVEHYSRFCVNPEKAKEVSKFYFDFKFDEFDKMNSDSAKMALFNSIDSTILKCLKASLKMNDSFVVAWLTFLDLQLSTSSKHYDDLRKTLREVDVRKYAMQNIEDMCLVVDPIMKELDNANQYQPSLTLSLLQRIRSSCTQSLQFPVKIDLKIIEVEKAVRNVSFLSTEDANAQMLSKQLDPESILKFIKDAYYTLKKDNLWEPANRQIDSGTVPSTLLNMDTSPANVNGKLTSALKALLQLDQSAFSNNGGDGKKTPQTSPCNICGKLGHWAPKCPDKDKSKSSRSMGGAATIVTSNRSSDKKGLGNVSWKRKPPGPNEPQTKKIKRRTFFWCSKCNRWSTSHGTLQHTKEEATIFRLRKIKAHTVL
jgi:hypothetical protein